MIGLLRYSTYGCLDFTLNVAYATFAHHYS